MPHQDSRRNTVGVDCRCRALGSCNYNLVQQKECEEDTKTCLDWHRVRPTENYHWILSGMMQTIRLVSRQVFFHFPQRSDSMWDMLALRNRSPLLRRHRAFVADFPRSLNNWEKSTWYLCNDIFKRLDSQIFSRIRTRNRRFSLKALLLIWFLLDVKEPPPMFKKSGGRRPQWCGQPLLVRVGYLWGEIFWYGDNHVILLQVS